MTEWRLRDRKWVLLIDGAAVDSLHHDPESLQYVDSRGVLVGKRWEDARRKCEERAAKFSKQKR